MSRIYSTKDRIHYKIDKYDFWIRPLSGIEKIQLNGLMSKAIQGDMVAAMEAVQETMKLTLKKVKGFTDVDEFGEEIEFQLKFEDDKLTDECVDGLMNHPISNKLNTLCSSLVGGITTEFLDDEGKPIKGIKFIDDGKPTKGKK